MKKKLMALLCAVVMMGSLVACSSEPNGSGTANQNTDAATEKAVAESDEAPDTSAESTDGEKTTSGAVDEITIGVSFGQNVHPFFVAMQKGIEQACGDLGINNINILSADSSLETQNSQIENLITMGCNVILLNPYDSAGVVNAVVAAEQAGVAVITMDVDCEGSTAFVASDNREIGKMLAQYVIEQLGGEGKIAIVDGITVSSLKDRTEGFMDVIEASDIEIAAEQQTAHGRETALQSAENILQAHSDIDAFVGINENSGMAIVSAVTSANLNDVIITTVDATSENLAAIRDGKVAVGVSQDPYQMGYQAVEQAIKWCQGEQVNEFVEVAVEYMNKDNVQEFIDREISYGVEID